MMSKKSGDVFSSFTIDIFGDQKAFSNTIKKMKNGKRKRLPPLFENSDISNYQGRALVYMKCSWCIKVLRFITVLLKEDSFIIDTMVDNIIWTVLSTKLENNVNLV